MHIFISYSKKDIEFARYLRSLLRDEKFAVWMDEEGISGGDKWEQTIEQGVRNCAALVIIMSPDSKESDWVNNALLLAQKLKKPVFPVLLRGEFWWTLAHIQYEDMQKGLQAKLPPRFIQRLHQLPISAPTLQKVTIKIEQADITEINADVVALKYAQYFFGADLAIASRLELQADIARTSLQAAPGEYVLTETYDVIKAPQALFLGVTRARDFGYSDIQEMSARVLHVLKEREITGEHLAMTIHGAGFGLDETVALIAQINGYLDAFHTNDLPPTLRQITIVERSPERVRRLRKNFENEFGTMLERASGDWAYEYAITVSEAAAPVETAAFAQASEEQPYAFVIMSNNPVLDDFFYYGIQSAVHASGDLCVRMDLTISDAEIMNQIKQKIDRAHFVIADLTDATMPAYLYLGYAWGKDRPIILVKKKDTITQVDGHDFLVYERIRDLEDGLRQQMDSLKSQGRLT